MNRISRFASINWSVVTPIKGKPQLARGQRAWRVTDAVVAAYTPTSPDD